MNIPSKSELRSLMEPQSGPCISLFLPTHRAGPEGQQDPVRLRRQIREVENRLLLSKGAATQTESLLKPLQALLGDQQFWLHPSDGLTIFRSSGVFRTYRVPYSFQELVVVTHHFYLKPLLPFLTNDGHFYILALSQNAVRLLECTRYSVHELPLPEIVPQSLDQDSVYDDPDNQVRYHSSSSGALVGKGGRRAVVFYGQGVGIDDTKVRLLRYFQHIDRALHELLHMETVPLILAGVDYLLPIYREANTYPHLLEEGVTGNPDRKDAEDLCEDAWLVAEPYFFKAQQEAAAQYRAFAGTKRAAHTIKEAVLAAAAGRVESLFVATDQEQWGIFDPTSGLLHVHKEARFGDDDLLDIAATQTLLHGGVVYAVEQANMPEITSVAAVFRY